MFFFYSFKQKSHLFCYNCVYFFFFLQSLPFGSNTVKTMAYFFLSASVFPLACKAENHRIYSGRLCKVHALNINTLKTLFFHFIYYCFCYKVHEYVPSKFSPSFSLYIYLSSSLVHVFFSLDLFVPMCMYILFFFVLLPVFHLYLKISEPYLSFRMCTCTIFNVQQLNFKLGIKTKYSAYFCIQVLLFRIL